mmetsp:Transcript_75553/g.218249  ORF Transcript_75553/g.218249 Transcript_75553/m.218249 type:complete len:536 (-) Transcript_75553:336-1943(-)
MLKTGAGMAACSTAGSAWVACDKSELWQKHPSAASLAAWTRRSSTSVSRRPEGASSGAGGAASLGSGAWAGSAAESAEPAGASGAASGRSEASRAAASPAAGAAACANSKSGSPIAAIRTAGLSSLALSDVGDVLSRVVGASDTSAGVAEAASPRSDSASDDAGDVNMLGPAASFATSPLAVLSFTSSAPHRGRSPSRQSKTAIDDVSEAPAASAAAGGTAAAIPAAAALPAALGRAALWMSRAGGLPRPGRPFRLKEAALAEALLEAEALAPNEWAGQIGDTPARRDDMPKAAPTVLVRTPPSLSSLSGKAPPRPGDSARPSGGLGVGEPPGAPLFLDGDVPRRPATTLLSVAPRGGAWPLTAALPRGAWGAAADFNPRAAASAPSALRGLARGVCAAAGASSRKQTAKERGTPMAAAISSLRYTKSAGTQKPCFCSSSTMIHKCCGRMSSFAPVRATASAMPLRVGESGRSQASGAAVEGTSSNASPKSVDHGGQDGVTEPLEMPSAPMSAAGGGLPAAVNVSDEASTDTDGG